MVLKWANTVSAFHPPRYCCTLCFSDGQCDQMPILLFNIWPFRTTTKWQNFAKSGHTGDGYWDSNMIGVTRCTMFCLFLAIYNNENLSKSIKIGQRDSKFRQIRSNVFGQRLFNFNQSGEISLNLLTLRSMFFHSALLFII